ncbi:MAG TPA: NAD(P)H-binding protein [Motilibacterales bacterium]|nr:NAD(P)H-binding protein [Motilibacterales bacterium]
MILVCGATGELGGRVARRLVEKVPVRAVVRAAAGAPDLEPAGVEVVRGDLADAQSLAGALTGVDTVVTTVTAIGRILSGARDVTIAGVDGAGNQNLIRAAQAAGVTRFVFLSVAGMGPELAGMGPLPGAKWAAEQALAGTAMQRVIIRPDMFQELWLAPMTGIDAAAGRALIYGRGDTRQRYVAIDDVANLVAHLALADDPPGVVEFGGPEALTRMEVVARFEQATGVPMKVRHVPRVALSVGRRVMSRPKPEIASLMGMSLYSDTHPATWDDAPLRAAGIAPRPASEFIDAAARALGGASV